MMPLLFLFNKWLISLLFFANTVHPFHVSATEMEYNISDRRVEISTRVFTDDFENILAKLYRQKIDLTNEKLKPHMTELVSKYITTHLSLRSDGKLLPLQFFGWEIDHEAVYIYTTAAAPRFNIKNITVEKTVLFDLFNDQENIIHFIVSGTRKSLKLDYPERKAQFSF